MHRQLETYLEEVKTHLRSLPPGKQHEEIQEIRQHLQALIAANVERGNSETEAVTAGLRQFGSSKQVGRALRQAQAGQAQAGKEMIKSKKFFLVVFTVLHAAATFSMYDAVNYSYSFPSTMGFYILTAPLGSPALLLHFNSTLEITSTWFWCSLGLLNSFLWAWLAWHVSHVRARRRAVR